jgi:hypothetical protein
MQLRSRLKCGMRLSFIRTRDIPFKHALKSHPSLFVRGCGGRSQAIEAQVACHLRVVVFEVARQFKKSPRAWLFGSTKECNGVSEL